MQGNDGNMQGSPAPARELEKPAVVPYGRGGRRVRWRLIVLVAVLLSIWPAWRYGVAPAMAQWEAYSQQRRLEAAIMPRGTILYSDALELVRKLEEDLQYDGFEPPRPTSVRRRCPPGKAFPLWRGMVPVGVLAAPGEEGRLVYAGTVTTGDDPNRVAALPMYAVASRSGLVPGVRQKLLRVDAIWIGPRPGDVLTVRAGEVDPADPAHVTMEYELNGEGGTVDGWLLPSDAMKWVIRSGPATTRPARSVEVPLEQ